MPTPLLSGRPGVVCLNYKEYRTGRNTLRLRQIGICRYVLMKRIDNDTFYDYIKQYDPDREYHLVGEVDYHLLSDDKPYEGMESHREALRVVFEWLVKQSIEDKERARIMFGDDLADKLQPLVYDIDKAKPSLLDPQVFFYCPNIVKTDYYGSVFYDAEWKPDDENFGTTVPYWYALMEPVHGRRNKPEDFKEVNKVLFPMPDMNGMAHVAGASMIRP